MSLLKPNLTFLLILYLMLKGEPISKVNKAKTFINCAMLT